jgi:tetratricopeptide (TPR) repeat protein
MMSFLSSASLTVLPSGGLSLSIPGSYQKQPQVAPITAPIVSQFHPEPSSSSIYINSSSFGAVSSIVLSAGKDAKKEEPNVKKSKKRALARMIDDEYESKPSEAKKLDIKSITLISSVSESDPSALVALKREYETLASNGNFEAAMTKNEECQQLIEQLTKTQENFPYKDEMAKLLYNRGVILIKLKYYQEAIDVFEEAGIFYSNLQKINEEKKCELNKNAIQEFSIEEMVRSFIKSFKLG